MPTKIEEIAKKVEKIAKTVEPKDLVLQARAELADVKVERDALAKRVLECEDTVTKFRACLQKLQRTCTIDYSELGELLK